MRALLALCLSIPLFGTAGVAAQEPRHEPKPTTTADVMRANLEPSYLVLPLPFSGLDPVWYEANVVAHFVVHRQPWNFAFVLTPKVVLRLFREYSEPVKTPSYMPRLALFMWLNQSRDRKQPIRYASFTVLHHSNGQAGPTFLPGRRPNHEDGDFYTNYFELAVHSFDPTLPAFRWARLALELHPAILQQEDLVGRYGTVRLQLDATILEQPSFGGSLSARVGATLDSLAHYASDPIMYQLERFPLSVAYSVAFEGSEVALFARYYLGRDYYNIWFDRTAHMLQIGITSHVAPFLGADP